MHAPELAGEPLGSRHGTPNHDMCTPSCSSDILAASEYAFSYNRMLKNCHRLRIGAIRSRKPRETPGST